MIDTGARYFNNTFKGIPLSDPTTTIDTNSDYDIFKKSSPLKLLSQSQPNFAVMILGWSPSKIVSGISDLRPRWPRATGSRQDGFYVNFP
jgi:hypothetical protein